jgi:uncharacterized membrane protein
MTASQTAHAPPGKAPPAPMAPALLMGLGLGGFVDGIVLHQILQWHHMLTDTGDHPADTVAGLETNTVADGFFHMGTWVFVLIGTLLTVRAWQEGRLAPPWRTHAGLLLVGWGLFNLVEGLIDHHILSIHNVRDDVADPLWWNVGFLVLGALLVLAGAALVRSGRVRLTRAADARATLGPGVAVSETQRR